LFHFSFSNGFKHKNEYKNGPVRKDKAGFIKPDSSLSVLGKIAYKQNENNHNNGYNNGNKQNKPKEAKGQSEAEKGGNKKNGHRRSDARNNRIVRGSARSTRAVAICGGRSAVHRKTKTEAVHAAPPSKDGHIIARCISMRQ
jgi:hypothetical protein